MIRYAGFEVLADSVSYPYLWWSREDLGLGECLLGVKPAGVREESLINLVAIKPLR